MVWTGLIWNKDGAEGRAADNCERGNEPSGFMKFKEFLE